MSGVARVQRLGTQGRVQADQVALEGVGANQSAEAADELTATEELQQLLAVALVPGVQDGDEQAFLRSEVVHDVRRTHPGPLADLTQRAGAEAAFREDGPRRVDEGAVGLPAGCIRPARSAPGATGCRIRHLR